MNNIRIGVLTTFYCWDTSYSLTTVVESQLVALKKYGYNPVLFVLPSFKDDAKVPEGIEIRKVIPQLKLIDYGVNQPLADNFEEDVKKVEEAFKEHLKDINVIFEHDMILQGWFLPYCVAIHNFANTSNIKWFHWIHSIPNLIPKDTNYPHSLRYSLPRNSKLVFLNNYHLIRAAEAYQIFPSDVRIVYNPIDPRLFYELHPLVKSLIDKYSLLDADFLQVYPVSTPRMMSGKQVNVVIEILAKLKEQGHKVRLIVCNAHANAQNEKDMVEDVWQDSAEKGLSKNEIIFTSFEGKEYELGVPRQVVSQLFQLSNLFIFPSVSENCSLILLEAMLSKCLLVLNDSVPQLREFGGDNAIYFKFGGLDESVSYDDREHFMGDVAKIIISEFSRNRALKASQKIKQKFNYDYIFCKQILPLLNEYGN